MMKNKNKTKKDYEESVDIDETIKYIFKTKEKDVFNIEYNILFEDLKNNHFSKIKPFILSNFVQSKIFQLNQYNEFIKDYLENSTSDKFNLKSNLDLGEEYKIAKNYMMQKLNANLTDCKDFIKEDLNKLTFLNRKRKDNSFKNSTDKENKDNDSLSLISEEKFFSKFNILKSIENNLDFENNNINIEKNENVFEKVNFIDKNIIKIKETVNVDNNKKNIFMEKNNINQNNNIQLKLTYADGSDSFPQFLSLSTHECVDFDNFLIVLKKRLGIFEYARFKLILIDDNKEKYFIKSINQFNLEKINEVKIVPYDYKIR